MKNTFLSQVDAFHVTFRYRQPTPVAPDLTDAATNALRARLLREEVQELHQATCRVDQLDALCDTQYVLSGAVLAWGYRSLWENMVHSMELRKIRDMDAHIAAMLGMVAMMETSAELGMQHQLFTELCYLQKQLTRAVWGFGFAPVFDAAFATVHENNMRKLWNDAQLEKYIFENGGSEISFEKVTHGGWLVRRSDGKIQKPDDFAKVDLGRFV